MHNIKDTWRKAISLTSCLSELANTASWRRLKSDEDPLLLGDSYITDEHKIGMSKAFRVLAKKTQVFTFPESPHIRTRLTHVMEVVAVSVKASEMLGLNTNLVRAIAMGHDIGHVPYGHQGEHWMAHAMGKPKFCHEVMGVIVAQRVERSGKGLNLAWHTLDGMMRHSGDLAVDEMSQEAWLVRYCDKIAYIFADINDIIRRMGYNAGPALMEVANAFGNTQRERTNTAIAGLVIESAEAGRVRFEDSELAQSFKLLRKLMYEIYPCVSEQDVGSKLEPVLECLTRLKVGDPWLLLALMTDEDIAFMNERRMKDLQAFNRTSVSRIAGSLKDLGKIDLCDPGLDWFQDPDEDRL
jgi:dGTPase